MSLGVNDLKSKIYFIYEDQPCMVFETHHLKMQQRRPVVQTKFRNLISGKMLERNFAQSDMFEEADIQKKQVKFLYSHRDEYWFAEPSDPSKRFELEKEIIGEESIKFLKPNTILEALLFNDKVINVSLPIKMEFEVIQAPPAIRGNTAQGGTKTVKIDTSLPGQGTELNVPLFINEGDTIIVNTETGQYVERAAKE